MLTFPKVPIPPNWPERSKRMVFRPHLAAQMAAAVPAGPPPTTRISVSAYTGTWRSNTIAEFVTVDPLPVNFSLIIKNEIVSL
ncbi:hypothetical protein D3C87_1855410 [compost metagenome]